jgi:hypothetical protein
MTALALLNQQSYQAGGNQPSYSVAVSGFISDQYPDLGFGFWPV